MQAMFSQISSPVPFSCLGDSNPPLTPGQGGIISASPMVRRMNLTRNANTPPPHVSPLTRRIGILGPVRVPSNPSYNVLPSMIMMLGDQDGNSATTDTDPRNQSLTSVMDPGSLRTLRI